MKYLQTTHSKSVGKRVLVVCMFDSIHSAKWLTQIAGNQELEIYIFPSKKFRHLNPKLYRLLKDVGNIHLTRVHRFVPRYFIGYWLYLRFEVLANLLGQSIDCMRAKSLEKTSAQLAPEIVHALEIQGAGYLVNEAFRNIPKPKKMILTNWGSDIYYYQNDELEKKRIRECLRNFTHYSAECHRDYELALEFGFNGKMLPCIPNSGGLEVSKFNSPVSLSSTRRLIIVKAYGGKFGLGKLAASICLEVLEQSELPEVHFYSVTRDVEPLITSITNRHPNRVTYSTVRKSLDHDRLIEKFKTARCYLGMSRSDGISTSFLESLAFGAFPIQTDTSCAIEWLNYGAVGFVTSSNNQEKVIEKILEIFSSDELVNYAQRKNREVARVHLSAQAISLKSKVFYD